MVAGKEILKKLKVGDKSSNSEATKSESRAPKIGKKQNEDDESSNSEATKSDPRAQKTSKKEQETMKPVEKADVDNWRWYDRGVKIHQAEKFHKGACANCGSMTHDAKSCFERARKVGAKFTGKHIAADEKVESFELDYAGKRDRWNGYDTSQYCRVQDKKFEEKRMARFNYLMKQKPEEDKSRNEEDDPNASAVNYVPAIPESKWEEDIYVNNHTSVWGSYWENHRWGYKCCLQTDKQSFCTTA